MIDIKTIKEISKIVEEDNNINEDIILSIEFELLENRKRKQHSFSIYDIGDPVFHSKGKSVSFNGNLCKTLEEKLCFLVFNKKSLSQVNKAHRRGDQPMLVIKELVNFAAVYYLFYLYVSNPQLIDFYTILTEDESFSELERKFDNFIDNKNLIIDKLLIKKLFYRSVIATPKNKLLKDMFFDLVYKPLYDSLLLTGQEFSEHYTYLNFDHLVVYFDENKLFWKFLSPKYSLNSYVKERKEIIKCRKIIVNAIISDYIQNYSKNVLNVKTQKILKYLKDVKEANNLAKNKAFRTILDNEVLEFKQKVLKYLP